MAEELDAKFDDKFSLEIQKKFVGLLVFDTNWAALCGFDLIQPQYFENSTLRTICQWIHDFFKKYKKVPSEETLQQQAKEYVETSGIGLKTYFLYRDMIKDIYTRDDNDDTEYYKDKIKVFVRQAVWKQALAKGTSVLRYDNYEEALNEFKKVLSIGTETDLGLDTTELPTSKFLEMLSEAYDPSNLITTGLANWDKALGGGFVKKNLHIIAAPPGGGKSRTMAFLAKNAAKQRKKVIFITLELDEKDTLANIYTAATGIDTNGMLSPEEQNEFDRRLMTFKQTYNPEILVKFYKPSTVTADTIHNYIQRIIQKKTEQYGYAWKPDVIFVDYLDKLLPTQKLKGSIYEDIGGVADDCKNLAISFDCPVISGSQLGRYGWVVNGADVVTMDSIAESAKKVHLAHSMTTINMNQNEKELHIARLFLAKSRTGRPGSIVWCAYDLRRCNLNEIEPWDPKTLTSTATYTLKDTTHR